MGTQVLRIGANLDNNLRIVVLHIEDDDGCAYALSFAIREQNANVDVFRVPDGEGALRFLTHRDAFTDAPRPDIIVLDLNLPKKQGHEVLAEIRQLTALQHVPVVLCTSSVRPEDREKAFALGANAYVGKPRDLEGFARVASDVLRFLSA